VTQALKLKIASVLVSNCPKFWGLCIISIAIFGGADTRADPLMTAEFASAVSALNTKKFADKAKAATSLSRLQHERVDEVLNAMLKGRLFFRKSDRLILIATPRKGSYRIENAVDGQDLGETGKRKVKKISVNNKLRAKLRTLIALRGINSPEDAVRLAAVLGMRDTIDSETTALLREMATKETSRSVLKQISLSIALFDLESSDPEIQFVAIKTVGTSLDRLVRNKLQIIADDSTAPKGNRDAADAALISIERQARLFQFIETCFFGISLGSILVLAAVGLAITFGVMGVINMAHGELMMLGAYTTYVVQSAFPDLIDQSLFIAIPVAFLVTGLVGIAIERGVIRHLYGRPLETLLATFGISLVLQQAVRSIFSPLNRAVSTPSWMSGSWEINSVLSLTFNRLYILVFTLVVFFLLVATLRYTRFGLEIRAVSQNRSMAKAMGVRSEWIDALTFGLGSGIAGVAGVALSQLTNVGPNLGQSYIVDCFMVVVFGGVGNVWGTLVSGLSLGVANKFLEPFMGAVVAKVLILIFIILFIQKRPRGLFPQKGRSAGT